MQTLLDSQKNAIDKLCTLKVGALFMEPGTGKTLAAWNLISSTGCDYVLWLTPYRNKGNQRTLITQYNGSGITYDVIGIETLSSSDRVYLNCQRNLLSAKCPAIVVDESLKIKNFEAKRTQRIIDLGKLCEYKLLLNGTPISRNLLDIWAQFEFLSPKILHMKFQEFKNTFCEYTTITKRYGHRLHSKEFINRYHNVDYLYSIIQPYVYECDLSLDIGKQYIDIYFSLDEELKNEYDYLKKEYLNNEKLQWLNNNFFLELTQKMQHIYTNSTEKYFIVDKIITDKTLIFRKYVDADVELKKRYPLTKIMSIQSDSFGQNLQYYDTIIIWDKVWDYALLKQMEHRIYRTGQKNECRFINLNGNVGLEKLILENNKKKIDLLTYFKTKALREAIQEL